MRLETFLEGYPLVRLAVAADNDRILEFFDRKGLAASSFEVRYLRGPDFFKLLGHQCDRWFVFLSEDAQGNVRGIGSLGLRPGWMDGKPATIGYLGDLRVDADRALARLWRRIFFELMSRPGEIDELADCEHWYTVVLDANQGYLNNFRSRGSRPDRLELLPIARFTMRNLVFRIPLPRPRTGASWTISNATEGERQILTEFFEETNARSPMGFRGELQRRLRVWEGLRLEDFIVARDEQGVVACFAPWDPSPVKRTVVSRLPLSLRFLGAIARRLKRIPLRIPAAGGELRALYLTHLVFADRLEHPMRGRVVRAMLDRLFDDGFRSRHDWHCVSLCDFEEWSLGAQLGNYVQETLPISIYAVSPADRSRAVADRWSGMRPEFEMAMV